MLGNVLKDHNILKSVLLAEKAFDFYERNNTHLEAYKINKKVFKGLKTLKRQRTH